MTLPLHSTKIIVHIFVLGAACVGHLDDLAVFNRALTGPEVKRVHALKNGIKALHP